MSSSIQPKILIIVGPTACRKTYYSLQIAEKHNAEIISADSMLIYKYLDIGTAKPSHEEQMRVPHHMIDIINPHEYFSAKDFETKVDQIISDIHTRGKNIIVVGGTGFFIKAFTKGLFDLPSDNLTEIRLKLENETTEELYKKLQSFDRKKAIELHPHNRLRIIRALEVYYLTGRPISEFQEEHQFQKNKYSYLKIGLFLERSVMYERINARVDHMIAMGLEEEVKNLLSLGYDKKNKPLKTFAYSYFIDAHEKLITREVAIEKTKQGTRRFAKRQLTWYKKDSEILWLHAMNDEQKTFEICNDFFNGGSIS